MKTLDQTNSKLTTWASPFGRSTPRWAFIEKQLGFPVSLRETVEQEKVNVAMLPAGGPRIELLEAIGAGFGDREIHREARRRSASRGGQGRRILPPRWSA